MHQSAGTGLVLILLMAGMTGEVSGQTDAHRFGLQFLLGPSFSNASGEYKGDPERSLSMDLTAGITLSRIGSGNAVLLASGASRITSRTETAECILTPDGGCLESAPDFMTASLTLGWQTNSGSLRATLGPAVARADFGGGSAWGVQMRLEKAFRQEPSSYALVLGLRGAFMPDYRGENARVIAVGAGVRWR